MAARISPVANLRTNTTRFFMMFLDLLVRDGRFWSFKASIGNFRPRSTFW